MALNFPNAPADGDTFNDYVYDATKNVWRSVSGTTAMMVSSPTAPVDPPENIFWFKSDTGEVFFRYNDGNSTQWISVNAPSTDIELTSRVTTLETTTSTTTTQLNAIRSGYYTRQIFQQVDTTNRSATGWTLGPTFSTLTGFTANSKIKLFYFVPARNDNGGWGGMYIEPQVQFNGGTWQSLGSSGYDGNVMTANNADIGSYTQSILISPNISTAYSVAFRFYFKAYDGTAYWNLNHDINAVSGTASIMSGDNGLQHYMHIIVEELATGQ